MNEAQWKVEQEKKAVRDRTVKAGEEAAVKWFRVSSSSVTSPKLLDEHIVEIFRAGKALGERIGRGEL